jgi:drug/metabolite transporter (DMT)-like permease
MTAPARHHARSVAAVLAAATLWGVNGVVLGSLFRRAVEPSHVVQVRMLVGGLALLPVARLAGWWRLAPGLWPGVAAYALVLAAVQLAYLEAIRVAGVAVAIFLQYTAPLLVAAWEAARARRLPPRPVMLALAAAVAGAGLLVLPGQGRAIPAAGFAWGAAAALAMASLTVVAGALRRRGASAPALLSTGLVLGSLAFLPVRSPWAALAAVQPGDWPYFLYVAILATAVPFTLYAVALGHLSGSVTMLLAMLEPVLAAALAWAVLGEALRPVQLAGGALILGAIALASRGNRALPGARPAASAGKL